MVKHGETSPFLEDFMGIMGIDNFLGQHEVSEEWMA